MPKTRMQRYRERMRQMGQRQIYHWVLETRTTEFKTEADRQCRLVSARVEPDDVFAFPEAFALLT